MPTIDKPATQQPASLDDNQIMQIGIDRIAGPIDHEAIFVMQIGVTRVGKGGRVKPRSARGQMVSVDRLVAFEWCDDEPSVQPAQPAVAVESAPVEAAVAPIEAADYDGPGPRVTLEERIWTLAGRIVTAAVLTFPLVELARVWF